MTFGAAIVHSRRLFRSYLASVVLKTPQLLMFYTFLMGCPIGMFTFLDQSKIGSRSLVSFMNLIYPKFVKGEGMDRLCWKPAKSWGFEVRGYYYSPTSIDGMSFLWKMVWCSKVPSSFLLLDHYSREDLKYR